MENKKVYTSKDPKIIEEITKSTFKETYELFISEAYNDAEAKVCEIHNAFGNTDQDHNCLGCNLSDSIDQIKLVLEQHNSHSQLKTSYPLYILSLYLMVERMETIMEIVSVAEIIREKHFKVFQQIRKWANFIKHPKSFILVHHPLYNFENSAFEYTKSFQIIINDQFVTEYYKGQKSPEDHKKTNKILYEKLNNKKDVLVMFPDILQLTKKFCYSLSKFIELITKNATYIEILRDQTTIENYFEEQK